MLKGSLAQISLVEVIRLLVSSQQTGMLHIMDTGNAVMTGGCYFQVGKLVHAVMGKGTGLDALNEMCRILDGTFAFEAGVAAPGTSLAPYPTPALVERIADEMKEFQALARATPGPLDVLRYLPGRTVEGLEATPDQLAVLLLCSGERTVEEIAGLSGMPFADLRTALAKFRHHGLLELVGTRGAVAEAPAAPVPTSAPAPAPEPEPPAAEAAAPKVVRYWRGKPVVE